MTISARTAAVSCLLALLSDLGSARASWATRRLTRPELVQMAPAWSEPPVAGDHKVAATETGFFKESTGSWIDRLRRDCGCTGWTIRQDAVLLTRSAAQPLDILFAPLPELNVAELGFDFQSGPRIGVTRHFCHDWGLQFAYLGIDGWTASAQHSGTNPPLIYPPGVIVSTRFDVDYSSVLYSVEANLCRRHNDYLDLLAGFRRVEIQEDFHVVGEIIPPWTTVPRYHTHADNHMYGFQIGADARVLDRGLLRLDGFIKAGIYANHAHQATYTIHNLGIPRTAGDRRDHAAFLGELGLTAVCRLGEHWSVRGGYQVMWVEGVSLAPDQIPHTDVTLFSPGLATLNTNGGLLYHGCHVGLQARW